MGIFDFFKGKKENYKDSVLRVKKNKMVDIGNITLYIGKPFNGICYSREEDGGKSEIEMVDGLKHGIGKVNYKNGQLKKEGNYKDGKKDGLWKFYRKNGRLESEGNYKDGQKDGLTKRYRMYGQLDSEQYWKDGRHLHKYYHENGQYVGESTYNKDGNQDGLKKRYYDNGQLKHDWNYKDGKPKMIIANTVKGKGVSFMENNNEWHHNVLTKNKYELALAELEG